jgi:hypothetical protein
MIKPECDAMLLEDLGVSELCLNGLRQAGFADVGDIILFLEQTWEGRAGTIGFAPYFLDHVDETVSRLKHIGCWPDGFNT